MATTTPAPATVWLRSPRFDVALQLGAAAAVAPPLLLYAALDPARAQRVVPLAALVAVPFLHVFGSFFFAFSTERNHSPTSPRTLAALWAAWCVAAVTLVELAPRALATFALLYGGWHILRQNFGFLRELAGRAGVGADRTLRRLDLAACAAPAVALWLLVAHRGPWRFIGAEIFHPQLSAVPFRVALLAIPLTALARELYLARRARATTPAALLLLAGNVAALLAPALFLDDLTLIYTLSASFHGIQYLVYLAERERERLPHADPVGALAPLAGAIVGMMLAWFAAMALVALFAHAGIADRALVLAWYAIVPFHYFADGRIWKRRSTAAARPRAAR